MQATFKNLTRKLSLPVVALPALFVTLASLGGLVSAVVGSAAASQPGSLLFPLRQPALGLRLALTRNPEERSAIELRMQAAPAREFEISGEISSIADEAWTIAGQSVRVDALTELDSGLRVGVQARAEGHVMADETWLAREIETLESGEGPEAEAPGNDSDDSDDDSSGESGSEESEPGDDDDGDDSNSGPGSGDDDGTEEADDSGSEGDGSDDSGSDDSEDSSSGSGGEVEDDESSGPGSGDDDEDDNSGPGDGDDDGDNSGSNSGEGGGEGDEDPEDD